MEELKKSFRQLNWEGRLKKLQEEAGLTSDDIKLLKGQKLPISLAEHCIENSIGYFPIPLGVATHFRIDGRSLFIPMAVEETSIIAAASATAKWISKRGEILSYTKGRLIIGQIQIPNLKNPAQAVECLTQNKTRLIESANAFVPSLTKRGGGIRDIEIRLLEEASLSPMLVLHVLCDPCDAMGANIINQVCEGLKPIVEDLTSEKVGLCILSNLVDGRMAGAKVILKNVDPVEGRGIVEATLFAKRDPYRAATHNKGTLNGIDPVLIATGNDWRAVEAGIHAYAARSGKYQPITDWVMEGSDLIGTIEAPLSLGIVGGMTRLHPWARICLKILKIQSADDLARICVAVGLVQNLGALRALSTVGIVKGHMLLHASNLAIAAGAEVHEIAEVRTYLTRELAQKKAISVSMAKKILESIRIGGLQRDTYL